MNYEIDGQRLHGPGGLGGVSFPSAQLHHQHSSDKPLIDLVRMHPCEITLVALGPLTAVARAFDRDPELPGMIQRLICVGGSWHEPGNATAVAEFHFYCDPISARQVLRSGVPLTLVPLDVTRKLVFSPSDLLELPNPESRACRFLRKIVPYGIRMTSNLYGVEGFYLKDVLGVVAVSLPNVLSVKPMRVDVETRGELTRGMSVFDARPEVKEASNVDLGLPKCRFELLPVLLVSALYLGSGLEEPLEDEVLDEVGRSERRTTGVECLEDFLGVLVGREVDDHHLQQIASDGLNSGCTNLNVLLAVHR